MHAGALEGPHDLLTAWHFDPAVVLSLGAAALACHVGQRTLQLRTGGRTPPSWRRACQLGGFATLVVALVSPVDPLGEALFSGHMVQHLLLTLVAAPLLVLGDVGTMMLWSLPLRIRRAAGSALRAPTVRVLWRTVTVPVVAWTVHGGILLFWHLRAPYELALRSDAVHAIEHITFLASALLFWWVVAAPRARARMSLGGSLLFLFTAATLSAVFGALATIARHPWYLAHARTSLAWGLTPLEDQQLAGLIMWVPAGVIYLVAGGAVVAPALRERVALPA